MSKFCRSLFKRKFKTESEFSFISAALIVFLSAMFPQGAGCVSPVEGTSQGHVLVTDTTAGKKERIFVVYGSAENRDEFRIYARELSRLKPFGRVDVSINCPAVKSFYELPEGICDWHEYASYNRSVTAFFPDKKIVPFIPAELVEANRQMLLYRAGVLKEYGLNAAFLSNEPRYLPSAFFDKYPELRGPRVDHPRRSVMKEFSLCIHQPGTLEMYHNMTGQLFKAVPGLRTFYFSMNDAGSGSCWCDWLYTGPNGPAACKDADKSDGIVRMMNIYKEEARKNTGHELEIYFKGMLTDEEKDDLVKKLPGGCFLETRNTPATRNVSTLLDAAYPVRGIIDPLRIIRTFREKPGSPERIIIDLSSIYSRAHECEATTQKVVDILVYILENQGKIADEQQVLMHFCNEWAGAEKADILYNALKKLNAATEKPRPSLSGMSTLYWGVSARQIIRPLVFAPELLRPEEEAYFLPHVFNISKDEARRDYTDIHGGHRQLPLHAADSLINDLKTVCNLLGTVKNAPEQKFIDDLGKSLKLYCCVLRTCCNFNDAQVIRDRNKAVFSGSPHHPEKEATWTGDQDLLDFNALMRDEFDNSLEMINLLAGDGLGLICTAQPPFKEDTFVLGTDLVNQLKKKRTVMLAHWTDIEHYLVTPFK